MVPMNNKVRLPKDFVVVVPSAQKFKGTWLQPVGDHPVVLVQGGLRGDCPRDKAHSGTQVGQGVEDNLRGPHGGGVHSGHATCEVAALQP